MHPILTAIASVSQVVLINVVLSGDNALVVALAARQLPPEQRRKAMIWGIGLAVGMRLVLTLMVAYLLLVPGLQLIGAVLLAWIACRLLQEESDSAGHEGAAPSSLRTAVARIALADLVMSLDNVVAIAGVSRSDTVQLVLGLVISIAMIVACSTAIMAIMNRFRWIAFVGTGVLALTAAGMISHDLATLRAGEIPAWADWSFRLLFAIACLTSIWWWPAIRSFRLSGPFPRTRSSGVLEHSEA